MLRIDEAIAFERQQAKDKRNEHYTFGIQKSKEAAEEHEQLAEWLEELKAYREIGTVEECKNAIDWCTEEYDEEYNEDIIYEMNCPKCHYDMFEIYDKVCNGSKSKYCKITNIHSSSCGDFYGTDWDVECICPKCKTKFTFSDEDYETFGLKFNDGLSVKE